MSLDVHLRTKDIDGNTMYVYDGNITHNLAEMANMAGIYEALWRPEEKDWKHAKDIVEVLEKGLADLETKPTFYAQFDSPNGWGVYENLVSLVRDYLEACRKYPSAEIEVSR